MSDSPVLDFQIPGSPTRLHFQRDEKGRLRRLWSDQRVYYVEDETGEQVYDDGLASVRELPMDRVLTRHVRAAGTSWIEEYVFDAAGRPVRIDGVTIERDDRHRIVACRGAGHEWLYAYSGDFLSVIHTPHGRRHVTRGAGGRPVAVRNGSRPEPIAYDAQGRRRGVPRVPASWHHDELGRLWTIAGADGRIESTFLWDGFRCLGRIDGSLGQPLAVCFSLDPTFTPVRIISRSGVTRLPRDAFGEGLLEHRRIPGLYGGTVFEGLVHYRSRIADVRTGSFDGPDPLHGRGDDPRRGDGYRGRLLIETPPCGPYAVAQYDAVGRFDPTGEISVPLLLSTFTWSWQHNAAGWLGLDLTVGLIFDIVGSIVQLIWLAFGNPGEALIKRYFDYEGLYNERTGIWGIRRGFFGNARAFTYQHMVVASHEGFETLDVINALLPPAPFAPRLDGTILRVDLASGAPLLLRGNRDRVLTDWTRSGGTASPGSTTAIAPAAVAPGSPVPWFPAGGLHLQAAATTATVPQNCTLSELVPLASPIIAASVGSLLTTVLPGGTPAAAGDRVLLSDGAGALDIKTFGSVTPLPGTAGVSVTFAEPGIRTATTGIRLRGLTNAVTTETLTTAGAPAPAGRLSTAGSTGSYANGDPVLLSQAGTPIGALLISLEAQITLDGPLPSPPFDKLGSIEPVPAPASLPNAATLDAATSTLSGAALPAVGALIALNGGGITLGAFVSGSAAAGSVVIDRTQAELTPLGANVTWATLPTAAVSIGTAPAGSAGATLTYVPAQARTLPAALTTFVLLRNGSNVTARLVSAVAYDAVVIGTPPPGSSAAPYSVARFAFRIPPDVSGLSLAPNANLTLPAGAALPAGTTTLQLIDLGAAALAAGANRITNVAIDGNSIAQPGAPIGNLTAAQFAAGGVAPSQLVIVTNGAALEPHVVQRIRAFVVLDRNVTVAIGAEVSLVALNSSGISYAMNVIGTNTVVVLPAVGPLPAAPPVTNVQMPRFAAGNLLLLTIAGVTTVCRVTNVAGTTLTLADLPANLVAGTAGAVQLLVPVAPGAGSGGGPGGNGTWRVGHRGAPTAGGAGTVTATNYTFEIWNIAHVAAGATVAVVQTTTTPPTTQVANVQSVTFRVDLLSSPAVPAPAAGATMNVAAPAGPLTNFYAAGFSQSGTSLTLTNLVGAPPPAPAGAVAVIPYGLPATGALTMAAVPTSSGTVRVPDDAELWEIDRRKSLGFHELTHTGQSALWGPFFMGFFPLFLIEAAAEIFTDADLPAFSAYVGGRITQMGTNWFLVIEDPGGVEFATGDMVQVTGATVTSRLMRLGAHTENRYQIEHDAAISNGTDVQVRRAQGSDTASKTLRTLVDAGKVLTLGGITNLAFGATWGHIFRWIADLWYVITNRVFHGGASFGASIQSPTTFRMAEDAGRRGVQGFVRVFVEKDGRSQLVDVTAIDENLVTIRQSLTLTGDIKVRPYDSGDRIDGLDYWDATVADAARPARITVSPRANNRRLSLDPFDRVSVAAGFRTTRTNVTVSNGDGTFDLQDVPPTFGAARELRIAKVDENDPVSRLDSGFLAEMGVGWIRYITDPYGQLQFASDVSATGAWRVAWETFARSLRYAFSSRSFTALLPIPGYLFLDDLFRNWGLFGANGGWESQMEQEASQESGNPYSPIGKLRNGLGTGGATRAGVVGDIAHYWYTPDWVGAGLLGVINIANLQDTPGVNLGNNVVVVPTASADPGAGSSTLNGPIAPTDTVTPGRCVPDLLFTKNAGNPHAPVTGGPQGFSPTALGTIPMTPSLELSHGMYVAFTQPGNHRATVFDSIPNGIRSRQAFRAGKQTIFFDVNVSDVAVTISGIVLAVQPPTGALPVITLVLTQPAPIAIVGGPTGGAWALTATQPGTTVTVGPGLLLTAGLTAGTDVVEISRQYGVNAAGTAYVDGVLATYGTNQPAPLTPIDISVRVFQVNVVTTLTISLTMVVAAASVANWTPGQSGFVLVPTSVRTALALGAPAYPGGTPPIARDPAPVIATVTPIPANLQAFIGLGVIFTVTFPANDPPEAPATLPFTVGVGTAAAPGTLTLQVTLDPNFTLDAPSFQVVRGDPPIVLTASDGTQIAAAPTVSVGDPTGLTLTPSGATLSVSAAATAPTGRRQILVADAANPGRMAARTVTVV